MAKVVIRHSRLRDFRRCPLKEKMKWQDGWHSPKVSEASALGSAWHEVMAAHYNEIRCQQKQLGYDHWVKSVNNDYVPQTAPDYLLDDVQASVLDALDSDKADTLQWMYQGYVDLYGLDPDWEILVVEREFEAQLLGPSGKPSGFWLQWHTDLMVRDHSMGGKVLVIDNKSTAAPVGQNDIDLDDQYGLYVWGARTLGYNVIAPVANQAKTKQLKRPMTLDERFVRTFSYRTHIEQNNIMADALATMKAMTSAANRRLPYSNPDPRICGWSCEFLDAHLAARKDPRGYDVLNSLLPARGFTQEDNTIPRA